MAFDGITVAAVIDEIKKKMIGCRIYKIAQTESDELILTIKGNSGQWRILLSADATLPLVYITENNKPAPLQAPGFCMLLRKYLTNARIVDITQPGLERVVRFELEHLNEMGDVCKKYLIVEIMGKHSNIILTDESNMILDSIKHISHNVSSVREVLPGREWFIPDTMGKHDPLTVEKEEFENLMRNAHMPAQKAVYTQFTGISPMMGTEICVRANVDADATVSSCSDDDIERIWFVWTQVMDDVRSGKFSPQIIYTGATPVEFCSMQTKMYADCEMVSFESVSQMLEKYYRDKAIVVRIRQKSADLRKIVTNALERTVKKLDLQQKQMEDTKKKDKYRVYGELINAYGYGVEPGAKSFRALDYYSNEEIEIPLDPDLTVLENGKKYFDRYSKLKRTAEALESLIAENENEVEHLRSILTSIDIAVLEEDLTQIKAELAQAGYVKVAKGQKKEKITSKPFHYVSSDGFDIYVGKNNFQNDELTFSFANGNDWWFHAKKMPGSHVVVRTNGAEVPDRTFEEAGRLAAHFSAGRDADKVEIDYTIRKNVKKPAGAKPGFVVYYTNYSMVSETDITGINAVKQ